MRRSVSWGLRRPRALPRLRPVRRAGLHLLIALGLGGTLAGPVRADGLPPAPPFTRMGVIPDPTPGAAGVPATHPTAASSPASPSRHPPGKPGHHRPAAALPAPTSAVRAIP